MKKLLFVLLLLSSINANHISWLGDYNKALKQAKQEKRPLMILLVKKGSSHCNKVIVQYFMNHDYIDKLNQKYIAVIVTFEGRLSYPRELFYTSTFPTLFIINSQNEQFLIHPIYF